MVAIDKERLPRHVAIIMDGNGRWATQRGLTRIVGHRRGKDSVKEVVETARRLGIPYLSLYAFSSENWHRPKDEVSALMRFLRHYLVTEVKRMMKKRERSADKLVRPPMTPDKRKRTKPRQFLREVRAELKRVAWPTRQEVVAYTLVVLVTVGFFMLIISGLDFVFLKAVVKLIGQG